MSFVALLKAAIRSRLLVPITGRIRAECASSQATATEVTSLSRRSATLASASSSDLLAVLNKALLQAETKQWS